MTSLFEILSERGLVHEAVNGTEALLKNQKVTGYVGFDPTADSLHVGHLVQVMLLVHLQRAGHRPIALVGGATGMVGDPSGKSQERNLLDEETVSKNVSAISKQLQKFLDFSGSNGALLLNNLDWIGSMTFIEFIRDVGKHIPVGYMLAKESVKKRLEVGLSFTEFTYQLLQAYDFYHLFSNHQCLLQLGGADQWGNMTTGTELIRRKSGKDAFALTSPLLTKSDGTKFGKTESGAVWLDPERTSPYAFYQFWLRANDLDAMRYAYIFSLAEMEELKTRIDDHKLEPHALNLQRFLAQEITERVHGSEALRLAEITTEFLFGKGTTEQLNQLSEKEIQNVFQGVPTHLVPREDFLANNGLTDLLTELTNIFPSKSEARRQLKSGAISLNKEKVSEDYQTETKDLLQNKYLLLQRGKKNYHLIVVQ